MITFPRSRIKSTRCLISICAWRSEYIDSLRTEPPPMCSVSRGLAPAPFYKNLDVDASLHLETRTGVDSISFVCGFMNPEYFDKVKEEFDELYDD